MAQSLIFKGNTNSTQMEVILKVSNTAYPDGTLVKYLFGMKQPDIIYSGIQVKKDMWIKKAGKEIMKLRNTSSILAV